MCRTGTGGGWGGIFGAVILMLSLMALLPWPPGGKAVFSVPIILIAAEMALQRDKVWLPRWLSASRGLC